MITLENRWVLSLCSGLGGQCEAFVQHPLYTVVRIENNPILADTPHTRLLDIHGWLDWLPDLISQFGRPYLVIAAPPCRDFSRAFSAPGPTAQREGLVFRPDMRLLESCLDIIEFCNPKFWILENVMGAKNHFSVYVGQPKQIVGPFVFWGAFPPLIMSKDWTHSKYDGDSWSTDPLRANKRAKWPLEVSDALLSAVHWQSQLLDFE
jgi:hypothetical protein